MALLTAEDVLNKAFSKTKYREGFDQDEVDDFLDEVANTIATLTAERDEYASRLTQMQAGGAVAPAAASAPAAPVAAPVPVPSAALGGDQSATSMLAMAQKLHDDYLTAAEEEKSRILAEARQQADAMLANAEKDAQSKVAALEAQRASQLSALESESRQRIASLEAETTQRIASLEAERADLERKIDDLRRFERDYRGHLKSYLENLLGDLEHGAQKGEGTSGTGSVPQAVAPAPAAVTEPVSASQPVQAAPVSAPMPAAVPAPATEQTPHPFAPLGSPAQSTGSVPQWPTQ